MADAGSSSNPLLTDFDFPPFDRVEPAHLAGSPGIFAQTRQPDGKGVQQRWVTAAGDSIWLAAFQVGAPDFGDFAGLGPKIVATLTLPGSV